MTFLFQIFHATKSLLDRKFLTLGGFLNINTTYDKGGKALYTVEDKFEDANEVLDKQVALEYYLQTKVFMI